MMKPCPLCGLASIKVIYYGLPHLLCEDDQCNCLFGFWSDLTHSLPFNGWLYAYTGSYLPALIKWLFGRMG